VPLPSLFRPKRFKNNRELPIYLRLRQCLHLNHSAVREKFDTGNKARVVRGEEDNHLDNLIGMTHAAERNLRDKARLDLLGLFFRLRQAINSGSVDRAGADHVDPDLAGFQLVGPCAGSHGLGRLAIT
jgi:hypothetical protein